MATLEAQMKKKNPPEANAVAGAAPPLSMAQFGGGLRAGMGLFF